MDARMTRAPAPVQSGRLSGGRRLAVIGVAVVTLAVAAFAVGRGVASDSDSGGGTATGAATTAAASGPGTPATISGFAFAPPTITVKVGGAVTWTNKDGATHTVTSNDQSFASPDLPQGATFTANFKTAGTFPYICSIHTFMKGTVVVQP